MVRNPKALMTLIRNKISADVPIEEKSKWFHEKGITITHNDGIYYLKADPRGHTSKLTPVCNNVVYHNHHLCAFPGWPIQETTFTELKTKNFILNEDTIFIEPLDDGQTVYMYWDLIDEEWKFSSPKKLISPYTNAVKKIIKNTMSGEYCYTYTLKLIEAGENKGLYLESLFNHKTFKEESIKRVISFAHKFAIKYPQLYIIKDTDELEESDLPIIARDISGHKYKIINL